MEWEVAFTSAFEDWWNSLSEDEQVDENARVILLEKLGVGVGDEVSVMRDE
jgi:hypothetical protein